MDFVWCLCFVSFILILFGLYKLLYFNYAKQKYSVVIGKIADYEKLNTYEHRTTKYPLVHYEINGHRYVARGVGRVIMGKPVKVYYNPSNPYKCVLDGDNGISSIIFGLVFLIIPFIVFFNK